MYASRSGEGEANRNGGRGIYLRSPFSFCFVGLKLIPSALTLAASLLEGHRKARARRRLPFRAEGKGGYLSFLTLHSTEQATIAIPIITPMLEQHATVVRPAIARR